MGNAWLAEQTLCGGGQEVVVRGALVRTSPPILAYFKCRVAVAGKHNIKERARAKMQYEIRLLFSLLFATHVGHFNSPPPCSGALEIGTEGHTCPFSA